jgi:hypothetical protein
MNFNIGAGLTDLMKLRALNEQRSQYLGGLRTDLDALLHKEAVQRIYRDSAALVADDILAEIAEVDAGRLRMEHRRYSDPANGEFRNRELIRHVVAGLNQIGVFPSPGRIEELVAEKYFR